VDYGSTSTTRTPVSIRPTPLRCGGYFFTNLFQLEGQYISSDANSEELGSAVTASTDIMMVNGVFNFMPGKEIKPYVLVGLGQADVNVDVQGVGSQDDSGTAYQIGAGSRFFFGKTHRTAFRFDVSRINQDTFDDKTTNMTVSGGFTFRRANKRPLHASGFTRRPLRRPGLSLPARAAPAGQEWAPPVGARLSYSGRQTPSTRPKAAVRPAPGRYQGGRVNHDHDRSDRAGHGHGCGGGCQRRGRGLPPRGAALRRRRGRTGAQHLRQTFRNDHTEPLEVLRTFRCQPTAPWRPTSFIGARRVIGRIDRRRRAQRRAGAGRGARRASSTRSASISSPSAWGTCATRCTS
jgi:hypothetical protein